MLDGERSRFGLVRIHRVNLGIEDNEISTTRSLR
jgi:hypothetical protein